MIVYITQNKIKNSLKPFGFKTFSSEVIELLNKAFQNYIKNIIDKHAKHDKHDKHDKHAGGNASEATQSGGRVIMPMEYYGVQTSAYTENPVHSDMSVSDTWVRPPLEMNIAEGAGMTGGAAKFVLSLKSVESALEELSKKNNLDIYKKNKVVKHLQSKIETLFGEIIKKASKKSQEKSHLHAEDLKNIIDMKKYKILH